MTLRVTRLDIAIVLFTVPAVMMALGLAVTHHRPWALVTAVGCGAALAFRRHPGASGIALVATSTFLRIAYVGIGYSTQVDHARTAAERAFAGLSPYGVLFPSTTAPPEPYTYGPVGLMWWQPGVVVEVLAAVLMMLLLLRERSWLTLAVYAGVPFAVYLTPIGVNDYSPGLLITAGLLVARSRPFFGSLIIALAAAIKPYAFAWFLPMVGYGGLSAFIAFGAVTAVLWSPLLLWDPSSFLRSMQLHREVHPDQANALNLPLLRWIAVPVNLLGLLARNWNAMVLIGSATFVIYLFLDRWASLGYWLAVMPAAGIALEQWAFRSSGRVLEPTQLSSEPDFR